MRMNRRIARGEGSYLYDTTGRRYLDGSAGAAAFSIGHDNPEVNAAIASQLAQVGGLLGRSRHSPIRGHNSSVSRDGLLGVGSLKQLPKPVCQQSDGLPQGAELPNPDYRDGSVQVKRWGTQYFHGIDRMIPGNKASG